MLGRGRLLEKRGRPCAPGTPEARSKAECTAGAEARNQRDVLRTESHRPTGRWRTGNRLAACGVLSRMIPAPFAATLACRLVSVLFQLGSLGSVALAASAPSKPSPPPGATSDPFALTDLLPTPWQKNPRLYFMVVTEMSDEGRKLPEATPERPVYFQLRNSGYKEIGDAGAGEKTLPAEQVEPILLRALAVNGYLPAAEGQTPSLLIAYRWGLHSNLDPEHPDRNAVVRNRIDRAIMIGGDHFGRDVLQAYREAATFNSPEPLDALRMRDHRTHLMMDRIDDDIYYVVASAYDYASFAEGHPVHLWRTRITVPTAGITQQQTLPTLIATAGPFFGKETNFAESVSRRVREGNVEIGPATVVERPPSITPPNPAPAK